MVAKMQNKDFFQSPFLQSEDAAHKFLESIRWPNGPICPHCQCTKVYRLKPSSTGRRVIKCAGCRKQFSVTVGTIFEDSHLPLSKWLAAMHLMCSSKKGMNAHQVHRLLGITYKSAWFMAHRIRYAMVELSAIGTKLGGIVEVDETYVGGKQKGQHGRTMGLKQPVVSLVRNIDVVLDADELEEDGAISGRLEEINLHAGTNAFRIYPSVGPSKVICHFPKDLIGKAITAVNKHVNVYGKLKYKPRERYAQEVTVTDLEIYLDDAELPSLFDLRGIAPNATGGIPSEEFVARIRLAER